MSSFAYQAFLILTFPVEIAGAEVHITGTPNVTVDHGGEALLRCQYSGVYAPLSLVLRWVKRAQDMDSDIWMFDGESEMDFPTGHLNKFERVDTDVSKEHTIRLKHAELTDEGIYMCLIEYHGDEYSEDNENIHVSVIGM